MQGYGKELIFAWIVQMDRILVSKTSDMGSSPTKVREAANPNGVADD